MIRTPKTDATIKRCKIPPSLARIAYYASNDNGDFKPYFSYANPKVEEPKPKQAANDDARRKRSKKKPSKKPFWQEVAASAGSNR